MNEEHTDYDSLEEELDVTKNYEGVELNGNELTWTNDREAVRFIKENVLTPLEQRHFPVELAIKYPDYLDREPFMIENCLAFTMDFPNYTGTLGKYPVEGIRLFNNSRIKTAQLIEEDEAYANILKLKNAGDEALSAIVPIEESHFLEALAFIFESQKIFTEELEKPEFAELKEFISQTKGVQAPYVCAGLVYAESGLTGRLADLGTDGQGGVNRSEFMLLGGPLFAVMKEMEQKKQMLTHGQDVLETGEMSRLSDTYSVATNVELHTESYISLFNEIEGINILPPDETSKFFRIDIEQAEPAVVIENLRNAVTKLKVAAKEQKAKNHTSSPRAEKTIDLNLLKRTAYGTVLTRNLSSKDLARSEGRKERSDRGDIDYTNTAVLQNLRKNIAESTGDQYVADIITTEAAGFLAEQISMIKTRREWDVSDTEADKLDSIRIVFARDILRDLDKGDITMPHNKRSFEALVESIRYLDGDFKKDLRRYLIQKYGEDIDPQIIQEAIPLDIKTPTVTGIIGASSESGNYSYYIEEDPRISENEDYKTTQPYGWVYSGVSPAARLSGFYSHRRYADRLRLLKENKIPGLTEEERLTAIDNIEMTIGELNALRDANVSVIVMEDETRKKLGIDDSEVVVTETVPLKGMDPTNIAVYPIFPER